MFACYWDAYREVLDDARRRFSTRPEWLVCNQVSPLLVAELGHLASLREPRVCVTGRDHGHLGSVDLVLGLEQLGCGGCPSGAIFLAASTPYAFGAAVVMAR